MLSPELLRQLGEAGVEVEAARDALEPGLKPTSHPPRYFRRGRLWQGVIAAVVIVLVAARWKATATPTAGDLPEGRYNVASVKRADIIELADHLEVRLLGVAPASDTALTHSTTSAAERNAKAMAFARDFVSGGEVRLQFDRSRLDADGRYLAYLWIDGARGERLLNEDLLRAGLVDPAPSSLALCSSSMKRRLTRAAEAGTKR
jgi:endonuclease YncB( thermonuclease family)